MDWCKTYTKKLNHLLLLMVIYQIVFHAKLGYVKVTICHLYYLQYIYMNGINLLSEIQNQNNQPNEMENYIELFDLMCADDTILLAESEEDLQDTLSAMFNY